MTQVEEGTLLWQPSPAVQHNNNVAAYMRWLEGEEGLSFTSYHELWVWSVTEIERFWDSLARYFEVNFTTPPTTVLPERVMPGTRWFPGAELNYAEHVFRRASTDYPALIFRSETQGVTEVSWAELRGQTARVAEALRQAGVGVGDRVVAYLPNIPQTVAAFMATASLGATWSSCSPDFGIGAIVDRFAQIEPKVLFAVDGYTYGGKAFDRRDVVRTILEKMPTVTTVIFISYLDPAVTFDHPGLVRWDDVMARPEPELTFRSVPFDHPLWVVYSSGTTGLPKGMVHGHGGVVLEHLKLAAFHCDLKPGSRFFWHTSTGWIMWNILLGGLLVGSTAVLYDGNPGYPDLNVLWQYAQDARMTAFGTSAAFIHVCLKANLRPGETFDLSELEMIGSTGSPLSVEGFAWVYDAVKSDLWLNSISGGTDVVSAFVAGTPLLPVYAGELQARALGAKVEAFDDQGQPLLNTQGELVVTEPMPSMPVFFWNDPTGSRYRDAYFAEYPGIWRHGDWIRIDERDGCVIEGRSDSTLNRQGVRMGSAEIYSVVEAIPEIVDSLVVGVEEPREGYYMPLFVVLAPDQTLDAALESKIKNTLRGTLSPRHVPDAILAVPTIPRTLSGKKMEVPVKKLYLGVPLEKAASADATTDPAALKHFESLAQAHRAAATA